MKVLRPQQYVTLSLQLLFVIALASFVCFINISRTSVRDIDEGFHISATQEMRQTGNYFRPSINGMAYYNKPPLKLWLSLIPFRYVDDLNLSFRLLDGLAGIAIASLVFLSAKILLNSAWAGIWAVVLLFSARDFVTHHVLRSGTQDTFLVLFSTTAMLSGHRFYRELDAPEPSARQITKFGWLLGLVVGGAALVKTVAAFVVPTALVAFGLLNRARRQRLWKHRETVISAVLLALILPATYIIPHCILDPNAIQVFFTHELVDRALRGYHNHADYLYYFRRFLTAHAAVPTIPVAVGLLMIGSSIVRPKTNDSDTNTNLLFLLLWAAIPFLVLSAVHSRLPWYTAPTMPAFALIGGYGIVQIWNVAQRWFSECVVPDAVRRMVPADSFLITSLFGLILSLLFLAMVAQPAWSLGRILAYIATPPERTPFDLLAADFHRSEFSQSHNQRNTKQANSLGMTGSDKREALVINAPTVSILERPYFNSMSPRKITLDELPGGNARNTLFFTDVDTAFELLRTQQITGYRFYPPVNTPPQFNRPQWLAVLDTATPPLRSLIPTTRNYECDPRVITLPYGFGEPATPRGSYITESLAGISLDGDVVIRRLPTTVTLRLGVAPGLQDPVRISASLNGIPLDAQEFSRAQISEWKIKVPAKVFQNGGNTLALQLTTSERDASRRNLINCHSIGIEPKHPS